MLSTDVRLVLVHESYKYILCSTFCPPVSVLVCQSGEKSVILNMDRIKQFPKLTVALTL